MFCIVLAARTHLQNDVQWEVGAKKLLDFYGHLLGLPRLDDFNDTHSTPYSTFLIESVTLMAVIYSTNWSDKASPDQWPP